MDKNYVKIFDTTLRDGQQCPGAGMSFENNLAYARLAHQLRVDVLEAGFPSASKLDFEIVNTIAKELAPQAGSPVIAGLCQLRSEQIDKTIESLLPTVPYRKGRLHVYLPVDPKLMAASLGEERASNKKMLVDELHQLVARAASAGLEVEFSPEGYSRVGENFDFCTDLIRAAVAAGATTINCPDTIGGASRLQGPGYFVENMKRHAEIIAREFPRMEVIWSTHCHNDFGLAVDNSLNAVFSGPARQIEGCINGVGERAGNASLEQCVMIIRHFAECQANGEKPIHCGVRPEYFTQISDFVKHHMLPRQPHLPIIGENATRHSSGGHTNAILKDPAAYQPFDPAEVGGEISFSFGPLSGGNHARSIILSKGFTCTDGEKAVIAQFVKDLYRERRKGITDEELLEGYFEYRKPIRIEHFDYSKREDKATVTLQGEFFDRKGLITAEIGGRDSALAALKTIVDKEISGLEIISHRSESESSGISAVSVSYVVIQNGAGECFEGRGQDQDIEISAMKALLDAANRAYVSLKFRQEVEASAAVNS